MILTKTLTIKTKGNTDVIDITSQIQRIIEKEKISDGSVLIFVKGSTAALTTVEYENGLINDIKEFFETIIPSNKKYAHQKNFEFYHTLKLQEFLKVEFLTVIKNVNL